MPVLYLVRHGVAEDRGSKYPRDSERPLTARGRRRMKSVVSGWRALEGKPPKLDLILTSPLVRAKSTADIVSRGLDKKTPVERCVPLAPGHTPAEVAAALGKVKRAKTIALVGHEPDLGKLGAWLIGAGEPIQFKKGGIARIDVAALPPAQNGKLIWLATPKMLRGLD